MKVQDTHLKIPYAAPVVLVRGVRVEMLFCKSYTVGGSEEIGYDDWLNNQG